MPRPVDGAGASSSSPAPRSPPAWCADRSSGRPSRHFLKLLTDGEIAAAKATLPAYAEASNVEMGARPLATFLGCVEAGRGEQFGAYGAIGGSGHVSFMVRPSRE